MLKPKIMINKIIINKIQQDRSIIGKSGSQLSTDIGKSEGWISLLENERMKTISSKDLIHIFKILKSLNDEEAEKYVLDFLNEAKESIKQDKTIVYYDENDKLQTEENFKIITNQILDFFNIVFNDNKEYAFHTLGRFMENLQSDLGFMFGIISIPFNELEDVDIKVKKKLYAEMGNVVKKYIKEYGKNLEEESSDDN